MPDGDHVGIGRGRDPVADERSDRRTHGSAPPQHSRRRVQRDREITARGPGYDGNVAEDIRRRSGSPGRRPSSPRRDRQLSRERERWSPPGGDRRQRSTRRSLSVSSCMRMRWLLCGGLSQRSRRVHSTECRATCADGSDRNAKNEILDQGHRLHYPFRTAGQAEGSSPRVAAGIPSSSAGKLRHEVRSCRAACRPGGRRPWPTPCGDDLYPENYRRPYAKGVCAGADIGGGIGVRRRIDGAHVVLEWRIEHHRRRPRGPRSEESFQESAANATVALSAGAALTGVTVSIVGTSISSQVDASGRFTLLERALGRRRDENQRSGYRRHAAADPGSAVPAVRSRDSRQRW